MPQHSYKESDADERKATDLRVAVLGICLMVCILFVCTLFIDIQARKGVFELPRWLSVGDIEDARIILSSIIGAVSTVLGLVFSVVLLVLSMAATQFGPRLLRRFIINQNGRGSIGLFSATFLFSLFTLVAVRHNSIGEDFVPQVTTLTAVLLMIVSFGSLIAFSQSIRKEIQTGNLIAKVDEDLSKIITNYVVQHQERIKKGIHSKSEEHPQVVRQRALSEGYPVITNERGYLQGIDYEKLIKSAQTQDAVIILEVRPGNFVITDTSVAYVIPAEKGVMLTKNIHESLHIGPNRILTQDPEFAIVQIVEIGLRALSAGINDSFTGIACVDWLCNNISFLRDLPETGGVFLDETGHGRLIEVPLQFEHLVSTAFDMIRQASEHNPAILIRLLQNFIRLAPRLRSPKQRAALMRQVTVIRELVDLNLFTHTDSNDIMDLYQKANDALANKELIEKH